MALNFRFFQLRSQLVLALVAIVVTNVLADTLPRFPNLETSKITVSGVSAGGAMAIQLGVAYSDKITGVGAIAAPPYLCAWDSEIRAASLCTQFQKHFFKSVHVPEILMGTSHPIDDIAIIRDTEKLAAEGSISETRNIARQSVWLFRGYLDELGPTSESFRASIRFYKHYKAQLEVLQGNHKEETRNTNHTMPTNKDNLRSCSELATPDFISSCHFAAAERLLSHLYGDNRQQTGTGKLKEFDQRLYTVHAVVKQGGIEVESVAPSEIAMADTGWVFVPTSCEQGNACKVHVALHGCAQSEDYVRSQYGYLFFEKAGYNEWAAGHNVIVLYPQTATDSSKVPQFVGVAPNRTNPYGCFDWWGETNYNDPRFTVRAYATRFAPQMMSIMNMVDSLKKH